LGELKRLGTQRSKEKGKEKLADGEEKEILFGFCLFMAAI
jgi:hypothetical protein